MIERVSQRARLWLGTPFFDGARIRGVGADCAGLIEGLAHEFGLTTPDRVGSNHDVLTAARAFLKETDAITADCIVLLAIEPGGVPRHAGIVTDANTLIHAHWRAGVVENRFGNWFAKRVTHAFAWPSEAFVQI